MGLAQDRGLYADKHRDGGTDGEGGKGVKRLSVRMKANECMG